MSNLLTECSRQLHQKRLRTLKLSTGVHHVRSGRSSGRAQLGPEELNGLWPAASRFVNGGNLVNIWGDRIEIVYKIIATSTSLILQALVMLATFTSADCRRQHCLPKALRGCLILLMSKWLRR